MYMCTYANTCVFREVARAQAFVKEMLTPWAALDVGHMYTRPG